MTTGIELSRMRRAARITPGQMARALSVKLTTVWDWECSGKPLPPGLVDSYRIALKAIGEGM